MGDNVSISLDDYIKKKKIKVPRTPAGAQGRKKPKAVRAFGFVINAKGKNKKRAKNSFRRGQKTAGAGVAGGAGAALYKRKQATRKKFVFRTSSYRYLNLNNARNTPNANKTRAYKQGKFAQRGNKNKQANRGSGPQLSEAARRQLLKQLQAAPSVSRPTFKFANRQNKRNPKVPRNKFVARNNASKSRSLVVAQERLKKARQILANRRRILGSNSVAATSTASGRILFSKYGLLTTSRTNVRQNMMNIQQKIQRAQFARENFQQKLRPLLQTNVKAPAQPRRPARGRGARQRPAFSQQISIMPAASTREYYPTFYSGGGRGGGGLYADRITTGGYIDPDRPNRGVMYSDLDRPDRGAIYPKEPTNRNFAGRGSRSSRAADDDNWVHQQRRVINSNYSVGEARSGNRPVSAVSSGTTMDRAYLDPEIQHRISHIQEQGRRRRSGQDDNDILPDFRPAAASRMLVGERFKRLLNNK